MTIVLETETRILNAAKKIFEQHGYVGARMQHIADEAQISKASLHYYFRSKEKLFDHIFDETMIDFMVLISTWDEDDETWERKLQEFMLAFFKFLREKSLLFILREINRNPQILTSNKRYSNKANKFLSYFKKLQLEGKIKTIDVNVIYVMMHSLCAYPIINSTLFKLKMGLNETAFQSFLDEYPAVAANFLIQGIKK